MMTYFDLPAFLRTAILALSFVAMCVGLSMLPAVYRRKKLFPQILVPLGVLHCGAALLLYGSQIRAAKMGMAPPAVVEWFCRQPVLIPVVLVVIFMVYFIYTMYNQWRYSKTTLTRLSIKESIDKLSSGLCFSNSEGRVILLNRRMNELSHAIVGRDLQNALLFWETLCGEEVLDDVVRLSSGEHPSFRLPDGTVWSFGWEDLDGIFQLVATNTTQLQAMIDELKEKNTQLAALNLRLKEYGENVDELARAKERLETKARIHSELGQALLAARRYLVSEDQSEPPLDIWKRNIAVLRKEMEVTKREYSLDILRRAAKSVGIALCIHGQLPEAAPHRQLFLSAAVETLTNAVLHAKAKTLYIDLSESENSWTVRFTNDGIKPVRIVKEGGGLSSLRRRCEEMGAEMKVESFPVFVLTVTGREDQG
jgi:signal transduction histidine kinase